MDFENEFVAHGKIDILNFAPVEKNGSKSDIIYFGTAKNTIIKGAIYKSYGNKNTLGKVTIIESTTFKFL